MLHGDHDGGGAAGDGLLLQAVALGAQHHGQLFRPAQGGVVHRQGPFVQRHGRRGKAQGVQPVQGGAGPVGGAVPQPRPGHLEHRAHADPHGPAAQRVAAPRREQHGVHAQGRRAAEDGPDVGGVHDVFQHSHPAGPGADFLGPAGCGAAHGAEHAPGQGVAGEPRQHRPVRRIDGHAGAAGQQRRGGAVDLAALHQKGKGRIPGVQRRADDLGALGDEYPIFRLQLMAQLGFGQAGVDVQFGDVQVGDLDDRGHGRRTS